MDQRVQVFLANNRICVLSLIQADNTLHSAALHYAHVENPLSFIFMTERDSEKCTSLLDGSQREASLVVGMSEDDYTTFQSNGKVKAVLTDEPGLWNKYIEKYPERSRARLNPDYVLLHYVTDFWKYTNQKSQPMTKITSTGVVFQ